MKPLFFLAAGAALVFSPPPIRAQMKMPMPKSAAPAKVLNVAFLIYPGVEVLDLSGPLDVFVKANNLAPGSFNIFTVAAQTRTVASQDGALTLTARYGLQNSPRPDIVVVPGASLEQVEKLSADARVVAWLKRNSSPSQTLMSVCTGAFLLGRAGLLDGKKTTSHWLVLDDFQRQYPKTRAFQGVSYLADGNIVTTAGVSSGIEGAFFLIEKIKGKEVAATIAEAIQYRRAAASYPARKFARVILQKPSVVLKPGQKLTSLIDPVCGMTVKATTPNLALHQGHIYGFCSSHCRQQFEARPAKYLKKGVVMSKRS